MLRSEHLVVDSRLEALFKVHRWFKDVFASLEPDLMWIKGYDSQLNLAVAEGFTNAVRHAHAELPPETPITIDVALAGDRVDIYIWDHGDPFDPTKVSEPELGSLKQEGGYGWFLLRQVTDQVTYRRQEDKNCLAITQHRT